MAEILTRKRAEAFIRRAFERQPTSAWTADYKPAIRATRTEAPGKSRPSILCNVNRTGREVNALSLIERGAMCVALYHPLLVDLHEERVLQPFENLHPLSGHPLATGLALPGVKGTIAAFEQLGCLESHPMFRIRNEQGVVEPIPIPLIGDLFLYMRDEQGLYGVNWSCKTDWRDFGGASLDACVAAARGMTAGKALRRNAAEILYYQAVGIPTRWIDERTFPKALISNLEMLFTWQSGRHALDGFDFERLETLLDALMRTPGSPPLQELERTWRLLHRGTHGEFRTAVGVLIWDRIVRPDLSIQLLFDGPFRPERRDPLHELAPLFMRGVA